VQRARLEQAAEALTGRGSSVPRHFRRAVARAALAAEDLSSGLDCPMLGARLSPDRRARPHRPPRRAIRRNPSPACRQTILSAS
jgi:hypothetical protein